MKLRSYSSACIDGAWLRVTRQATAVRLPHEGADHLTLRMGRSALVLASAAMVAMPEQPARDRRAVEAMMRPLGFLPENVRRQMPVTGQAAFGTLRGLTVRDGREERAFFAGEPAEVLAQCAAIWDGQERGVTPEDGSRTRALPAGTTAFATAPVAGGMLGPLCYLGSVTVEDVPDPDALRSLFALWDTGFPVRVLADGTPLPQELPIVSELPEDCLYVPDDGSEADFARPIRDYLRRQKRLRRLLPRAGIALAGTAALAVLCALFLGAVGASLSNPLTWAFIGLSAAIAGAGWFAAARG